MHLFDKYYINVPAGIVLIKKLGYRKYRPVISWVNRGNLLYEGYEYRHFYNTVFVR